MDKVGNRETPTERTGLKPDNVKAVQQLIREINYHLSPHSMVAKNTLREWRDSLMTLLEQCAPQPPAEKPVKSEIIPVSGDEDGDVIIRDAVDFDALVGREVTAYSPYCGTYGPGGPGFAGFKLAATDTLPEEWLMLCLWGAANWLTVNNRWLEAHPSQYEIQKPLMSNLHNQTWDEFTPMVVGKTISSFEIAERAFTIKIGEAVITLSEDPNDRPLYWNGQSRVLPPGDDLRRAWILANSPGVWV